MKRKNISKKIMRRAVGSSRGGRGKEAGEEIELNEEITGWRNFEGD